MPHARTLIVSTYPPESCGIATFSRDLAEAVDGAAGSGVVRVAAIDRLSLPFRSDARVVHRISNADEQSYLKTAAFFNRGPFDVLNIQHEFGLFPGVWGGRVLELAEACDKPIVTTLHTLLQKPDNEPERVLRALTRRSEIVVVMTQVAADLLHGVYAVPRSQIRVIPHGVPTAAAASSAKAPAGHGLRGRRLIGSFGLISRGKGLEMMIRAMPEILRVCPEATYVIAGMTHPLVLRHEGEAYREQLTELAAVLGVADRVRFINAFLTRDELMAMLRSCELFVTPYPGEDQIASGTMAVAMSVVGAVISTPYLYAREVLADGRGVLVPFGDSRALANSAVRLLTDPVLLAATRRRAYRYAQSMFWPAVGRRYLDLYTEAAGRKSRAVISATRPRPALTPPPLPTVVRDRHRAKPFTPKPSTSKNLTP